MPMTPPIYQFQWTVPDAGYEVTAARFRLPNNKRSAKKDTFLIERIAPDSPTVTRYSPLVHETGLFREFASLRPTDEKAIVGFANKFGWLGADPIYVHRTYPSSKMPLSSLSSAFGERITAWQSGVSTMKHLADLWDRAQERDHPGLTEFIRWDDDGRRVRYEGPLGFSTIAADNYPTDFLGYLRVGDLIQPTLDFVRKNINKRLERHGTKSRLLWDPHYRRQSLHVIPDSLIAALWLQFARAVEGDKQYRQCEQCKRWFEVAAEVREDAKFCRNACRSKAYRERQKEARKLHSGGLSLKKISQRLDSDLKTVRGWVKRS